MIYTIYNTLLWYTITAYTMIYCDIVDPAPLVYPIIHLPVCHPDNDLGNIQLYYDVICFTLRYYIILWFSSGDRGQRR